MNLNTKKQRQQEGKMLKDMWLTYKAQSGETQASFSDRLGFDQGQLQGWFKGTQPIPEDKLLSMAAEMSFNPASIRPHLRTKALNLIQMTAPDKLKGLEIRLQRLPKSQLLELSSFLDYLESKSKED